LKHNFLSFAISFLADTGYDVDVLLRRGDCHAWLLHSHFAGTVGVLCTDLARALFDS
jgi:hypothetical protein